MKTLRQILEQIPEETLDKTAEEVYKEIYPDARVEPIQTGPDRGFAVYPGDPNFALLEDDPEAVAVYGANVTEADAWAAAVKELKLDDLV